MESTKVEENISIVDAIILTGIAPSKGQARTLISQGGISLNDTKIEDTSYMLSNSDFTDGYAILKKGKKIFRTNSRLLYSKRRWNNDAGSC